MSKFWQKKYISKYTGKEIDDAIGQVIEGGGGGVLVLSFASETTLNHTYAEVLAAYQNGVPVIFNMEQYTAVGTIAPQQGGSLVMMFTQVGYNPVMSRAEFWEVTITYNSDETFALDVKSYYWNVTASE